MISYPGQIARDFLIRLFETAFAINGDPLGIVAKSQKDNALKALRGPEPLGMNLQFFRALIHSTSHIDENDSISISFALFPQGQERSHRSIFMMDCQITKEEAMATLDALELAFEVEGAAAVRSSKKGRL